MSDTAVIAAGVEEAAESLHAAYMRDGMSPDTVEEPHDLRVRADAEWLRWLEADKWTWRPARRKELAERLFAEQAVRRCAAGFCSRIVPSRR